MTFLYVSVGPQNILPAPSSGGDSPSNTELLSPTSPTADGDLWSAPLISMKKEDGMDGGLGGGLDSPILPSGGIGGANTSGSNGNGNGANGNANGSAAGGVVKANKGMILRKSVEYIRCITI